MSNYERGALGKAEALIEELTFVTGKEYKSRSFVINDHYIEIIDVETMNVVMRFRGSTWRDAYYSTLSGLNAVHSFITLCEDSGLHID